MKHYFRRIGHFLLMGMRWILGKLPYPIYRAVRFVFVGIGLVVVGGKRKIMYQNLKIAYGKDESDPEIRSIARKCFKNVASSMIDFVYISDRPGAFSRNITIEGREHLDQALKDNKGAVLFGAHYGNFILMYMALAAAGYKTNVIMKRSRDAIFEEYISKYRNSHGVKTIYDLPGRQCVQQCLKALRNNELLVILIDQNYGGDGRVFVDFFGRPAATATGPVVFAQRTGAVVFPIFMVYEPKDLSHRIMIKPRFELIESANSDQTIPDNIARMTKILENEIRLRPHEWAGWMHKRWKSMSIEDQIKADQLAASGDLTGRLYK